ncbi:Vacuolar protein sorting-associated protein 35 [Rhizoclosmatium sp. JEL0117]|nr:Vacuolar protein sorting-associated protein 35 [Rhizoclosmatium sp. JEL0117]
MRKSLELCAVMDAFRHASLMLATLRTSLLTPKNYYELYMAIFDQLSSHLALYLYDGHLAGQHNLSDLYELVQYAGNIVPRLYLMITVGSVYMRVAAKLLAAENPPNQETYQGEVPPIKELLNDMLEMARGVQHPTRGLFLRYYLSVMTRDHMPNFVIDSPLGTLSTSIHFILQNFIEMNKLWVRLQYIGHSSERDKREVERKELRVIVGSGIVRLSQLDGLGWEHFKATVLPSILGEVVNCKDPIAQDYLMDIIIQVFPEDFHFRTLDLFLSASVQLSKPIHVKQSIIGLIDRFIAFVERIKEEAEESRKSGSLSPVIETDGESTEDALGIPKEVPLFDLFWEQITVLISTRPEFTLLDTASLLGPLLNLSLNCYPDRVDQVDKILGFAKDRVLTAKKTDLKDTKTMTSILQLLLSPVQFYRHNILLLLTLPSSKTQTAIVAATTSPYPHNALIEPHPTRPTSTSYCGNFTDLLRLLPHTSRRKVAHAVAKSVIQSAADPKQSFLIDTCDGVEAVFGELCSVLVTDCVDGNVCGPKHVPMKRGEDDQSVEEQRVLLEKLDWEDVQEEQNWIAKLIHTVKSRTADPDEDLELLAVLRQHLGTGGDVRIRFTLPPLVFRCMAIAHEYLGHSKLSETAISGRLLSMYHFMSETILALSRANFSYLDSGDDTYADAPSDFGTGIPTPSECSIRLFLSSALCANESGHEEAAYEFVVNALTVFEDSMFDSKTQVAMLTLVLGALEKMDVFGEENYDTLLTKVVGYCGKMIRKVDQARLLVSASVLFWEKEKSGVEGRVGVVSASPSASSASSQKLTTKSHKSDLFGEDDRRFQELKKHGVVSKPYRDGKRVLECLQRALKAADNLLDPAIKFELFVIILERYIQLYQGKVDSITIGHINSLIELIQNGLSNYNNASNITSASINPSAFSIFAGIAAVGTASGNNESLRRERDDEFPLPSMARRGTLAILMDVKTIGIVGGIAFLFNNMTGTALAQTSTLFQQAGWAPVISVFIMFGFISTIASLFLVEAMQTIPGNQHFQGTVEFATMINFYFGPVEHCLGQLCLYGSLMSQAISSIAMAGQSVDNLLVDVFKKTCGISMSSKGFHAVCVTGKSSLGFSPFDNNSIWNGLDSTLVPVINPTSIPTIFGVIMLNYPFISTVPSWINLKRNTVSAQHTLWTSAGIATLSYILIGLIPGFAFTIPSEGTLISVFEQVGKISDRVSGYMFSLTILLPSIPMFFVISNANLTQNFEFDSRILLFFTHIVPWFVAIPVSAGTTITAFNAISPLFFVSTANFIVPLVLYIRSCDFRTKYNASRELSQKQLKLLKLVHINSKSINTFIDNYELVRKVINEGRLRSHPLANSSDTIGATEHKGQSKFKHSPCAASLNSFTLQPKRLLSQPEMRETNDSGQLPSTDTLNNKREKDSMERLSKSNDSLNVPQRDRNLTKHLSTPNVNHLGTGTIRNLKSSHSSSLLQFPSVSTNPRVHKLSMSLSFDNIKDPLDVSISKQNSRLSFASSNRGRNTMPKSFAGNPGIVIESNLEGTSEEQSILASIEPFLLEDVPDPTSKCSKRNSVMSFKRTGSNLSPKMHNRSSPMLTPYNTTDVTPDVVVEVPTFSRSLHQPKYTSMINLHPEQNLQTSVSLKRSSTGVRRCQSKDRPIRSATTKTAHFLGADLPRNASLDSRTNSASFISANSKSVSFAGQPLSSHLKATASECQELPESISEQSVEYRPPLKMSNDRRQSEVSVASFFRNPLSLWNHRKSITSNIPNFPIQSEFVSPPFMAIPKWIPVEGKYVAMVCLGITCVCSILGIYFTFAS